VKIRRTREWLLLAALTFFGLGAFGLFHLLAGWLITPAKDVRDYYSGVVGFEDTAGPLTLPVRPSGTIGQTLRLALNQEVLIGDVRLIYRGLTSGGSFAIDVIVPAYDSQSPFHHSFDIAEAGRGFTLAGRSFRLLSATRTTLHLERAGG
jgi:hypothetical protein